MLSSYYNIFSCANIKKNIVIKTFFFHKLKYYLLLNYMMPNFDELFKLFLR